MLAKVRFENLLCLADHRLPPLSIMIMVITITCSIACQDL
jgi:hypothetical protein